MYYPGGIRNADDRAYLVFNNYTQDNFVMLDSDELKEEWLPAMARGEKIVLMGTTIRIGQADDTHWRHRNPVIINFPILIGSNNFG